MKRFVEQHTIFSLIILSCILYLPFLGNVHLFEWDEINFAECAREMLVSNNWTQVQIDFKEFWEKPPLFFWLQASCMKLFGINELSARLPNAVLGILQSIVIYKIGEKEVDKKFGLTWTLLLMVMPLPHLYFKSGIIDPWFNFFIFLSIYFLYKGINKINYGWLAGLFLGLAIITKGPVAILIVLLTAIIIIIKEKLRFKLIVNVTGKVAIVAILVTSLWLYPSIANNGLIGLNRFIAIQLDLLSKNIAGHQQPFYYHFFVLLIGCFPISILLFNKKIFKHPITPAESWIIIYGLISFITFSIVKTKIVHYSSLCYIPIAYLGSKYYYQLKIENLKFSLLQKSMFISISILLSLLLLTAPSIFNYLQTNINLINDTFAQHNILGSTKWPIYLSILGILVAICYYLFWQALIKGAQPILFMACSIIFVQLSIFAFVGRIEKITQNAHINFIKKYAQKGRVQTYHYSYGRYFYNKNNQALLLDQPNELAFIKKYKKPVYTVIRSNDEASFLAQYHAYVYKLEGAAGYLVYKWY
jgi:hypothetical protein